MKNKVIIISRFERMARILERELSKWNPICVTGQTQNRAELLKKFETDDSCRLLIGTTAIEQGLNLQVANILYNYDMPWNPARLEQREGRIHRQGQQKPCFIYNLVVDHTVEKWLLKKIESKRELSETLLPKNINQIKEMLE
jgi:SNF2 family DNA or RNA helicase